MSEPKPREEEIEFILETAGRYLSRPPQGRAVLWIRFRKALRHRGRPLRDHTIHIDPSGLLTITGGKWTTYRNMAEDCVNQAAELAGLPERRSPTKHLNIHGFHRHADKFGALAVYGSDAPAVRELMDAQPALAAPLHPALPYTEAEVVWATRAEMARSVEDVLARRTRALFLNARAAIAAAPRVGQLMASELRRGKDWAASQVSEFATLAGGYLVS